LQGFSKWLYQYYQGYPSTWDPKTGKGKDGNTAGKDVYKTVTNMGIGGSRTMITTPMVVKHIKQFFNCPTMQGAELEDDLGSGSVGSHWEQRLYEVGSHRSFWNVLPQNNPYFELTNKFLLQEACDSFLHTCVWVPGTTVNM
jgi:hypothetical protein